MFRASTLLVLCVACGGEHKTVAAKPQATAVAIFAWFAIVAGDAAAHWTVMRSSE